MNQVERKRKQAELIADMIGIINLLVLGILLKNSGIAYLAAAVEGANIFLILGNEGIADTLGRILRGRNNREQYKNAEKMCKNALALQCILGTVCSLALLAAAKPLAMHVFKLPHSYLLLLLLIPAVFLRTISEVFLGCFQGDGSELPTAVAAILRRALVFGFSILFCNIFLNYGKKVSALLGKEEFTFLYGGMGVATAISLAELLLLLFLFLMKKGSKRSAKRLPEEGKKATHSFLFFGKTLYGTRGMLLLMKLLKKLPIWLGLLFFQKSMESSDIMAAESYGLYYGKYLACCGFLVCAVGIFLLPSCAKTSLGTRKEEHRYAKKSFQSGVSVAWKSGLFFSVFCTVMALQLSGFLCGGENAVAESMFRTGSAFLLFLAMAYYFETTLLALGNKLLVLIGLGVMDIVFVITATIFLNKGQAGILALVYAGMLAAGVYAVLLGYFAFKELRCNVKWLQLFVLPIISAGISGLLCLFLGKLCTPHLGNGITAAVSLVLGLGSYFGILYAAERLLTNPSADY